MVASHPNICAIVDAFSTGNQLAPMLHAAGYKCIHIQSMHPILPVGAPSFQPDDFVANIVHQGDLQNTLEAVRHYKPACIINGSETGTILADWLADQLRLPGNSPATSNLRRNKYQMAERLRQSHIPAVQQLCSSDVKEIVGWAEQLDDWPVVIKPLDSAGSDGVTFCDDVPAVREAFKKIANIPNRLGGRNQEILIQQYLRGEQYIVNTVSIEGTHIIGEIQHAAKKAVQGVGLIYDYEEILPLEGTLQSTIKAYILRVLDALEFYHGPGHAEMVLTPNGPVLIEIASRMHGGILHKGVSMALDYSHVALTQEAYAHPDTLLEHKITLNHTLKNSVLFVHLISAGQGAVTMDKTIIQQLMQLPSYHSHLRLPEAGFAVQPTIDLFTAPGDIYLAHKDRNTVMKDLATIRQLEQNGLYEYQ